MEFIGTKQGDNMIFGIHQITLRKRYLTSLTDGTPISEKIEPIRKHKTHQQVKTIFGLAIQTCLDEFEHRGWDTSILLNLDRPTGVEITQGFLKEYFYAVCPIYSEEGKRITLSHRKCTTKCASDFIKAIGAWAAAWWEIYIPEPGESNGTEAQSKDIS